MTLPFKPTILSIALQKGGVGKTTSAVAIASILAEQGYKVGLIDMDPQANATDTLIEELPVNAMTIGDVMSPEFIEPVSNLFLDSTHKKLKNLKVLPSTIEAAAVYSSMIQNAVKYSCALMGVLDYQLKKDWDALREMFDIIIIDTPPNLNVELLNALVASHFVLSPIKSADKYALKGWEDFNTAFNSAKRLNKLLDHLGVFITMHDRRATICKQMFIKINEVFPMKGFNVFKQYIPSSVEVSYSAMSSTPINLFNRDHTVTKAYEELTRSIIKVLEAKKVMINEQQ